MLLTTNSTLKQRFIEILLAPVEHPEIVPSLLPLALGAIVLELYFGKYENESLGWNTSVGNAVIWISTGANLLIKGGLESAEKTVAYGLIGIGGLLGYMDFFHKWGEKIAFRASSAGVIYTVGYVTVIVAGTTIPVDRTTLKAGGVFVLGALATFQLIQYFETPAREEFQLRFN